MTNEEMRKAVELLWSAFLAKSEDLLHSYAVPGSTVFQIAMRLGAMRRSREYCGPDARMDLKLGPIDVVLIGGDAGVASYTFWFHASGCDGRFAFLLTDLVALALPKSALQISSGI